ncbi:MAG: sortase, partial [Renibacterium salmoninarum]|nr:sortase [Renibacterium salmoninarum]
SGMLGIIILFQLLTAAVIAAIWCWKRWGKWHTWIALAPILLTISILLGNQINMILPNLL